MIRTLRALLLAGITVLAAGCATVEKPGEETVGAGTWLTFGDEQDPFNIEIGEDGKAVTNFFKNPSGAKGERGVWKKKEAAIVVTYDSGWTDMLYPLGKWQFEKKGFKPGTTVDQEPSNVVRAMLVTGPGVEFIGVWRLAGPKEEPVWLALVSDGTAAKSKTNRPAEVGSWKVTKDGISAEWPGGDAVEITRAKKGKYVAKIQESGSKERVGVAALKARGRDH